MNNVVGLQTSRKIWLNNNNQNNLGRHFIRGDTISHLLLTIVKHKRGHQDRFFDYILLSLTNGLTSQAINMMILYGMGCHPLPVHFTNVMHAAERLTL